MDTQKNPNPALFLSVIMPALNEEENISLAIQDTLLAMEHFHIPGEIVVVNDGSSDATGKIAAEIIKPGPRGVRIITHAAPQGIGASFWDGVDSAKGNIVCLIPGDNEVAPLDLFRYFYLLESVDMVIPFVFNKEVRLPWRNFISGLYKWIINTTFLISLNWTNGTVLYRKSLLSEITFRCRGFFYQTDILVKLLKKGYLFAEAPYALRKRKAGRSKAINLKSFFQVLKSYLGLFRQIYLTASHSHRDYVADSLTYKRNQELSVVP